MSRLVPTARSVVAGALLAVPLALAGTGAAQGADAPRCTISDGANCDLALHDATIGAYRDGVLHVTNDLEAGGIAARVSGTAKDDFTVIDNQCASVVPGQDCDIYVRYEPVGTTPYDSYASLDLDFVASLRPLVVSQHGTLSGHAVAPAPTPAATTSAVSLQAKVGSLVSLKAGLG